MIVVRLFHGEDIELDAIVFTGEALGGANVLVCRVMDDGIAINILGSVSCFLDEGGRINT